VRVGKGTEGNMHKRAQVGSCHFSAQSPPMASHVIKETLKSLHYPTGPMFLGPCFPITCVA
jgi:hypothetical protein